MKKNCPATGTRHPGSTAAARMLAVSATVFGGGSLLFFGIFLLAGPFELIVFDIDPSGALLLDTGLSLIFFMQHSSMQRPALRRHLETRIPPAWSKAVYALISGLTLGILLLFWQVVPWQIASAHGLYAWLSYAAFALALAGFAWSSRTLGSLDAFGTRDIRHGLSDKAPLNQTFCTRGPFRWVRHPFYLSSLVMIWACPDLTADRLLFNLLWSAWIVVGARLEETDLVREFGRSYTEYQKQVPMLIPLAFSSRLGERPDPSQD